MSKSVVLPFDLANAWLVRGEMGDLVESSYLSYKYSNNTWTLISVIKQKQVHWKGHEMGGLIFVLQEFIK